MSHVEMVTITFALIVRQAGDLLFQTM